MKICLNVLVVYKILTGFYWKRLLAILLRHTSKLLMKLSAFVVALSLPRSASIAHLRNICYNVVQKSKQFVCLA